MEDTPPRTQLSPREQALVTLATAGHTDAEIAGRLGISEQSVGAYWGSIRQKLGPNNRADLLARIQERAERFEQAQLPETEAKVAEDLD